MKERSPRGFRSRRIVGRLTREKNEGERENWPLSFRVFGDMEVGKGREREEDRERASRAR